MIIGLFAAKVALHLYLIKAPKPLRDTAVSKAQAVQMWRETKSIFKRVGVNVELKRFKQINPHWGAKKYFSEENLGSEFYIDIFALATNMKIQPKSGIVHFLIPRSLSGYMYGESLFNVCGPNKIAYSYSTAQERNIVGTDRHMHSVVGMAHEMGHDMGMSHDVGLMAYEILLRPDTHISDYNLKELNACMAKKNPN